MFERRDILLNNTEIEKITNAKLAIFGLGGVGGIAFMSLVRMGFNDIVICDGDKFSESNLNRQVLSTLDSIGEYKTKIAKDRAISVNKNIKITEYPFFVNEDTINKIDLDERYIIDMIDDVKAKILLIKYAQEHGNKIISMMGAGNRINANFIVSDIYKTENDPLSKKMRYELKKEGIKKLKVVYTKDLPIKTDSKEIGSISFVVAKAGLTIAEEVTKDIIS